MGAMVDMAASSERAIAGSVGADKLELELHRASHMVKFATLNTCLNHVSLAQDLPFARESEPADRIARQLDAA